MYLRACLISPRGEILLVPVDGEHPRFVHSSPKITQRKTNFAKLVCFSVKAI